MTYTQEEVKKVFADAGCVLLSEYKNATTPLEYIGVCGHKTTVSSFWYFKNRRNSRKCKACSPKITYTPEEVEQRVSDEGCQLVRLWNDGKYKVVDIVCQCGHQHTLKFEKFCAGRGRVCPKCARPRGEKHANYNANLTDEERLKARDVWENVLWRRDVFAKDAYTCVVCGDAKGGNLEAHHLNGWADFPESRFDVGNGVTLCEKCHHSFHTKHGFGKNTREQFESWKKAQDNTEVIA